MAVLRRVAAGIAVLAVIGAGVGSLLLLSRALPTEGVMAKRILAAAYLICDVAIGSSLVILLVVRGRQPPDWVERLPYQGRWLWPALLCLTVLCYVGLAPTFLFFLLQVKR